MYVLGVRVPHNNVLWLYKKRKQPLLFEYGYFNIINTMNASCAFNNSENDCCVD